MQQIYKLSSGLTSYKAMSGNKLEALADAKDFFADIEKEISKAKTSIHMLFYIWESGGEVERVESALMEAAKRGVKVKVLVDGVGSENFRHSSARKKNDGGWSICSNLS